jgi:hypothetical protein
MILLALVICGVVASLVHLLFNIRDDFGTACLTIAGLFELLFAFSVASSAAWAITREKEARALPVLLTIPHDARVIIRDKAIGILRRNMHLLIPALVFGLLAVLLTSGGAGRNTLARIVRFEIGLAGNIVFLMELGLCLSVYLKTTVAAQALTLGLFVFSRIVASIVFSFPLFFGFRTFGGDSVQVWTFIVGVARAAADAGIAVILCCVAAGALRSRCQR